jgi:hypothetical protein
MVSEANQKEIEGCEAVVHPRHEDPRVPYVVAQWRREHPGQEIPDGHVLTQPWPAGPNGGRRDQVIYYQYKADRARRTLRRDRRAGRQGRAGSRREGPGEEEPVHPAIGRHSHREPRTGGQGPRPSRDQGYVTNLRACPDGTPVTAEFVIGAYHQLFEIEKSFRMSKSDLQARPIYHHERESIEAHLTIVFAALAVSRWIEHQTGWSIRKFVRTARRYRTFEIQAGPHTITAADPLPGDLRSALEAINHAS